MKPRRYVRRLSKKRAIFKKRGGRIGKRKRYNKYIKKTG